MKLIPGLAPALKFSTPTARWKHSADVALVGFGGLAGEGFRLTVRRLVRLLRATQRIGMR
jgi:hypothetical protein